MSLLTGTITDPNSPSVLYALIATELTNRGYVLDDTVVISTRTHKVWKNPAANNPSGKDWWIDVVYTTTGTGTIGFYVMEYYDPAADMSTRPAYSDSTTGIESTFYSKYGATAKTLEATDVFPRAGRTTSTEHRDNTLPATSFGYWISITSARVVALFSTNPTEVIYTGLYQQDAELLASIGALSFPLISARLLATGDCNSGNCAITRAPKVTVFPNYWWQAAATRGSTLLQALGYLPRIPGGSEGISKRKFIGIPVGWGNGNNSTGEALYQAGLWGWLIDCGVTLAESATGRGDTVTIGGTPWIVTSPQSGYVVGFKA